MGHFDRGVRKARLSVCYDDEIVPHGRCAKCGELYDRRNVADVMAHLHDDQEEAWIKSSAPGS